MNPINIVADAIRTADGNHTMGAGQLAEVAVGALIHEDILNNAAYALMEDPVSAGKTWEQCRKLAHTVLCSLGGA